MELHASPLGEYLEAALNLSCSRADRLARPHRATMRRLRTPADLLFGMP